MDEAREHKATTEKRISRWEPRARDFLSTKPDNRGLANPQGKEPLKDARGTGVDGTSRVHRKPSLVPDRFADEVPWRDFKAHFE